MIKNLKDKLFGIFVFTLFSIIGVSGFYCIYHVLSMLYIKLSEVFGNLIVELVLLVIPVIISIFLSGIFAYIFDIGLKVIIRSCFEKEE